MNRKTLIPTGTTDAKELLEWSLPPGKRSELLGVIHRAEGEPKAKEFIENIEHAIRSAIWREALQPRRADVMAALQKAAEQGKALLDAIDQIPEAGRACFRLEGESLHMAREKAYELWRVAERAALRAKDDLSGRGDDHDNNPAILAADIAEALRQAGLKPSLTRPKYDKHGKETKPLFWTVTVVCFKLASLPHKDPYPHMRDGLRSIPIIGCED